MLNAVVICLKNRTFAVSQTTHYQLFFVHRGLWFAWKIVLLQYRKQPWLISNSRVTRCDLLEKSYFCSIANNDTTGDQSATNVVICLKNRTFAVSQTTFLTWKQREYRCDLLEKSYFCSIANNFGMMIIQTIIVVICLKNRTFAVSQTTRYVLARSGHWLWFAWKIVLLQYRKQPAWGIISVTLCCDLLEKSYFCSIANNNVIKII